jgi:protein phosphatase
MDLSEALQCVGRSDAGMVRSHNEDAIYMDPARGLVVLADGMGGYNAGEVASGMATTLIGGELAGALARANLRRAAPEGHECARAMVAAEIARANGAIYQAAQSQPQYSGMGTTLVMAVFFDNAVCLAHIGDSRCYRYRDGRLELITRDHSLLQEQIDIGMITPEEARRSQNRNLVTRAVGVDPVVEAEVHEYDTLSGDIYLLCSDGLNDMVEDADIELTLRAMSANLELAAAQLVQMANDNGGRDNVSVILVKVLRAYPAERGIVERLRSWLE